MSDRRDFLIHALRECIISAKPERQADLQTALEEYASACGKHTYRLISQDTPLINGLLEAIEEATEARLFYEPDKDRPPTEDEVKRMFAATDHAASMKRK